MPPKRVIILLMEDHLRSNASRVRHGIRLILVVDLKPVQLRMSILNNVFKFRTEPISILAKLGKMLVTLRLGSKAVCHPGIDYMDQFAPMTCHLHALAMALRLGMSDFAEPRHPIEQDIDISGEPVRRGRWSPVSSRSDMREKFFRGLYEMRPGRRHIEARWIMLAQAKTEILQSNDCVTASEISNLAQFSSNNPSSQPNKWKQAGKIFALRHEGVDYFPIYGLDPAQGFRPFSALESVISTLAAMKDGGQ